MISKGLKALMDRHAREIAVHEMVLLDTLALCEHYEQRIAQMEFEMDRDHELAQEYGKISRKANREVEGKWYLREITWEDGREVKIVTRLQEDETLEHCGPEMTIEKMKELGWTITPIEIFRKD